MALVGVLSTQVWHETFCGPAEGRYPIETAAPRAVVQIDPEPAGVT
jgi:hypothetical protein